MQSGSRKRNAFEFHSAGFNLRKIQNVVDDSEEDSADELDHIQILALLGIEFGIQSQIGHAEDAVHGSANLMAHVGQEFALGKVGGFELCVHGLQFAGAGVNFSFQVFAMELEIPVAAVQQESAGPHDQTKDNDVCPGEDCQPKLGTVQAGILRPSRIHPRKIGTRPDRPGVAAIPKASRAESQQANLGALKVTLDDDDRKAIAALPKNMRCVNPAFAPAWD